MEKEFNYGVKVKLIKPFSVIRETLERLGIVNHRKKELYPSCYILHKKEQYYIIHFKNLLKLDGKKVDNFDSADENREKSIALLLEKWGLIEILEKEKVQNLEPQFIYILPFDLRGEYQVVQKYQIGGKSKKVY